MTWFSLRAAIFAVLMTVTSVEALAADRRPMSVDDMLKLEGVGAAAIDPDGRWLIYERRRPYDQSDDYSFRTAAMGKTGHQLWRYDLRNGGAPVLLPGVDPQPHSYLQGFASSGRFLTLIQYRFGALSIGAYNMASQKFIRFSGTPAYSRDGAYNPVWISDNELIFAALPAGQQPDLTSVRAFTGKTLAKAWNDAWNGKVVTASEVRAHSVDQSDQIEPGQLVRADARTGHTAIVARGLYADLRLSPDRRYLAALAVSKPRPVDPRKPADYDPRRYKLTLFDIKGGGTRSLASAIEFFPYSLVWAPDGRRVAAFGWRPGETPPNGRFYVIDVDTGTVRRYEHTGLDLVSERERGWLPRPERTSFLGDALAVFARRIPEGENQAPRFTSRNYDEKGLSKADWYALSPDGTSRNLTAGIVNVSGVPVHAGNGHVTVAADNGVYRLYADGTQRQLTPVLPGRFHFLPSGTFATRSSVIRPDFTDDAMLNVDGNGSSAAKIVMLDLRDGQEGHSVTMDAPAANAVPITGSLAAGTAFFRTENGPTTRLMIANITQPHTPPREIARLNGHLLNVDLGSWKVVSYAVKDPDDKHTMRTIESCVLLPPNFDPAKPPPLIVEVYPDVGPNCKDAGAGFDYPNPESPYLWAGKGYAYARLSTPHALIHTSDGPIAGMPAVVEAGIDALIAKGFVDAQRVALYGFSQGGISSLYVAAHSRRFKAVIAMNSWADLFSHYFGSNGVFSSVYGEYFGDFERYDEVVGTDFGIGRTPFDDPAIYYRNSPVFLAPGISAPVLLIHSDMDGFSMSQFDEMYAALTRAGKDVRYVRYWGEGHSPSSPANIRDLWQRMDSFLKENDIGGNPPAQNAIGPS